MACRTNAAAAAMQVAARGCELLAGAAGKEGARIEFAGKVVENAAAYGARVEVAGGEQRGRRSGSETQFSSQARKEGERL